MIILIFRNDDLLFEYLKVDNNFFWRVLESNGEEVAKKFVSPHELKRYFPWVSAETLPEFLKLFGIIDYTNNRRFNVFLYTGVQSLTKQPNGVIGKSITDTIGRIKAMKIVQDHVKTGGYCRIWDTLSVGFYWNFDGDHLDKVAEESTCA